jgi:hypothetical protein
VTTTRDDTRTERGPSGYCSALGDAMMGGFGGEGYSFQDDGKNNKEKKKIR